MYYRVDRDVADMIEVMMHTAFMHGTERIVRFFFELYFDEFKLPTNYTVHHYMISALGKPNNPAAHNQTTHYDLIRSRTMRTHNSSSQVFINDEEAKSIVDENDGEIMESFVSVDEELRENAQKKSDS